MQTLSRLPPLGGKSSTYHPSPYRIFLKIRKWYSQFTNQVRTFLLGRKENELFRARKSPAISTTGVVPGKATKPFICRRYNYFWVYKLYRNLNVLWTVIKRPLSPSPFESECTQTPSRCITGTHQAFCELRMSHFDLPTSRFVTQCPHRAECTGTGGSFN